MIPMATGCVYVSISPTLGLSALGVPWGQFVHPGPVPTSTRRHPATGRDQECTLYTSSESVTKVLDHGKTIKL